MFGAGRIDERAIAGTYVGKHLTISSLVSVYGDETYQVTPESPSAIRIISEEEAAFRLGKTKKAICKQGEADALARSSSKKTVSGRNSERVSRMLGSTEAKNSTSRKSHAQRLNISSVPSVSSTSKASTSSTRNASIIGKLKKSGDYSLVKNPTNKTSSVATNPVGTTPRAKSESSGLGYVLWIVVGLIILFVKCCA